MNKKESTRAFNEKVRKEHDEYMSIFLRFLIIRPATKFLIKHTKITPTQMTVLSIFPGIAGIILLCLGGYTYTLCGAILSTLYGLMDGSDGIIARARDMRSKFGGWLDGVIGFIFVPIMLLAIGIGLKDYLSLLIGAIAALTFPVHFSIIHFYKSEIVKNTERIEISKSGRFNFLRYVYGYALFYPVLMFGAIFDQMVLVILFFAIAGSIVLLSTIFLQSRIVKRG